MHLRYNLQMGNSYILYCKLLINFIMLVYSVMLLKIVKIIALKVTVKVPCRSTHCSLPTLARSLPQIQLSQSVIWWTRELNLCFILFTDMPSIQPGSKVGVKMIDSLFCSISTMLVTQFLPYSDHIGIETIHITIYGQEKGA